MKPLKSLFNKNSLHISILSFTREEEMLPDGHDTLVFSIEIFGIRISLISVDRKLKVPFVTVSFILSIHFFVQGR